LKRKSQFLNIKKSVIMRAVKQVIVNIEGHSWLGFYTSNQKFNNSLAEICELSQQDRYRVGKWANGFWVLEMDGHCVAVQPTLQGAMKYYNESRILVHYQKGFVY
jgi:hypothetical protein